MPNDYRQMDGKVVVITGGAGGIGAATARLLAARGARLVIADIAKEPAETVANDLADAIAVQFNLVDENSIRNLISTAVGHFGRLDALDNNAALLDEKIAPRDGNIEKMETEVWDQTMAVNLRGTMIACREALPHLRAAHGNIVNTVSNLALQGHMIQAAYAASKAALIQMTRSIAASHGRYGVRCNAVAPGMTMTPALQRAFPLPLREVMEAETLREQLGDPEDIAEAVAFLISDAARNITGHVLVSDGGLASHVPGLAQFEHFFGDTV